MDVLNAMRAFVSVVHEGNFSAAAKKENSTQSAISKKVAGLEKHLGSTLLTRTGRAVSLTESGEDFFARSQQILQQVEEAELAVTSCSTSLRAVLRVSMSPVLCRLLLLPILADFQRLYPEIKLILQLTERHCDLVAEGIDVVVRAGELEDSSLIAWRLSSNPFAAVAAPSYLEQYGEPEHPSDLTNHKCLVFRRLSQPQTWRFARGDDHVAVSVDGPLACDQGDSLVEFAVLGAGITIMPSWLMHDHICAGRLQTILRDWQPASLPIHIVYGGSRHVPEKIRRFSEFVRAEWKRRKALPK